MSAKQQAIFRSLGFLPGDEDRVLRVARGMIWRKIQRLKIVVISFNLRTFFHGIAQIAEDADNLVHRLDYRMLGTDGATNDGESDIECLAREFARRRSALNTSQRFIHCLLDSILEFVNALSDIAF